MNIESLLNKVEPQNLPLFYENENILSKFEDKDIRSILKRDESRKSFDMIQKDLIQHLKVFDSLSEPLKNICSINLVAGALRDLYFSSSVNDLDIYIAVDANKIEEIDKPFFIKQYSRLSLEEQNKFQDLIIQKFCGTMEKIHPLGFVHPPRNSSIPSSLPIWVPPTIKQTKEAFDNGKFWDVFFAPNNREFISFFKGTQPQIKIEMLLFFVCNEYAKNLENYSIKIDDAYFDNKIDNSTYSNDILSTFFKYHEDSKQTTYRNEENKRRAINYSGINGLNAIFKIKDNKFNYPSDLMFGFLPPNLYIKNFDFNISQMTLNINSQSISDFKSFLSDVGISKKCKEGIGEKTIEYSFFFQENLEAKSEKFVKRIKKRMESHKDLDMNFSFEGRLLFLENGNNALPDEDWGDDMKKEFEKVQSFIHKNILNVKIKNKINLTSMSEEVNIKEESFKL